MPRITTTTPAPALSPHIILQFLHSLQVHNPLAVQRITCYGWISRRRRRCCNQASAYNTTIYFQLVNAVANTLHRNRPVTVDMLRDLAHYQFCHHHRHAQLERMVALWQRIIAWYGDRNGAVLIEENRRDEEIEAELAVVWQRRRELVAEQAQRPRIRRHEEVGRGEVRRRGGVDAPGPRRLGQPVPPSNERRRGAVRRRVGVDAPGPLRLGQPVPPSIDSERRGAVAEVRRTPRRANTI